jgi:hypothetical protein
MKTKTYLFGGLLAVALFAVVWASSGGAPSKKTGAPGEGDCTGCHNDFAVQPAGTHLTLSGIPAQFTPGQTYSGTVSLRSNGSSVWGFELAVKDTALQAQAGNLVVTDAVHTQTKTGTVNSQLITYLTHTAAGNYGGQSGPVSWNFNWTAPSSSQPKVIFYLAALAGDNDGGTGNDSVFALSFTSTATSTAADDSKHPLPYRFALGQNYPNPFNTATVIPLELPKNGAAYELSIYNLAGQRVRHFSGAASGHSSVVWNGSDQEGRSVASGTYLYTLSFGAERLTRKMLLVK